jgi:hypothetical protein
MSIKSIIIAATLIAVAAPVMAQSAGGQGGRGGGGSVEGGGSGGPAVAAYGTVPNTRYRQEPTRGLDGCKEQTVTRVAGSPKARCFVQ